MSLKMVEEAVSWLTDLLKDGSKYIDENIPGGVVTVAVSCVVAYVSLRYIRSSYRMSKTREKIVARQEQRMARMQKLRKRLAALKDIDTSIIELSFHELQRKLQQGQLTPSRVLAAYQWKALQLNDEINCVTDFVDFAEAYAAELDKLSESERGPLHGIPFSVKEVTGIAGLDCTAGLCCMIDKLYPESGILVQTLMKQGAIPFAKTNIGQLQMSIATLNPIFGETLHPLNHERTCGGSSGGEGALVGGHGSILGIGCDMGGSIRCPSHFCGISGVKPTPGRLSDAGNTKVGQGIGTFTEVYGPMGRDVDACAEMIKAALCPGMWELDPLIPQMPWNDEIYKSTKPLRIGYYVYDGAMEVIPAVKRCVLQARDLLQRMGHTVVEFKPLDIIYSQELTFEAIFGDEGKSFSDLLVDEVVVDNLKGTFAVFSLPYPIRCLIAKCLYFMSPMERALLMVKPPKTVHKWWQLNEKIEDYRRSFAKAWKSQKLDAVICPAFPYVAFPKDMEESGALAGMTYTSLYNLLAYPAGVVPAGRVEKADLDAMKDYPRKTTADKWVHKITAGTEGLPVGVQCVSLPFHEEMVLRLMKELERGLKF